MPFAISAPRFLAVRLFIRSIYCVPPSSLRSPTTHYLLMQKVDTLLRLMLHASLRLLAAAVYDRH